MSQKDTKTPLEKSNNDTLSVGVCIYAWINADGEGELLGNDYTLIRKDTMNKFGIVGKEVKDIPDQVDTRISNMDTSQILYYGHVCGKPVKRNTVSKYYGKFQISYEGPHFIDGTWYIKVNCEEDEDFSHSDDSDGENSSDENEK